MNLRISKKIYAYRPKRKWNWFRYDKARVVIYRWLRNNENKTLKVIKKWKQESKEPKML